MGEEGATELGNKISGAVIMEGTKKSLRNIHEIVSTQVTYRHGDNGWSSS